MKEVVILLKNRNFVHLWTSQIISQIVVNTLSFLLLVYLFEKTGSTIATSLVWVAYALPALVFGPIAGVSADVANKRKVLVVTLAAEAVIVLVFSFLYSRYLFLAYGIVFFYSMANQFYIPAEAASLPILVKKKSLAFANSLFFMTTQLGLAVGFLSAGVLYETFGLRSSLMISSILLLVASISVSFLPKLKSTTKLPKGFSAGVSKFFEEFLEGYRFIKDTKKVFLPFFLLIGLQSALSVLMITVPVLARDIVHVRPSLAGITIIAPAIIGAISCSILISKAIARGVLQKRIIQISLFSLSLALVLLGAIVPSLYFWAGRTAAVVIFFIAGAAYVGTLIPTLTHLQISTPEDKLGRVFGSIWFITTAATVIPVLFSATITEVFGVGLTTTILGLFGFAMFFVTEFSESGALRLRFENVLKRRKHD